MMLLNFNPDKERLYDCPLIDYTETYENIINSEENSNGLQ